MNILTEDKIAVRIPDLISRYRANCAWGTFVHGNTGDLNIIKAQKAGLTKGSFVELALCYIDNKILTFKPHYENESFTEIWGIPVKGEIKDQFPENASELTTFLLHRQSQDKFKEMLETFHREAFNAWINEGMKGDPDAYVIDKLSEFFFTNIFRFEMVSVKGEYGNYYYIETTYRKPDDKEVHFLNIAKKLYQLQIEGNGYCQDPRIEENHIKCMMAMNETKSLVEAK